MIPGSNTYLQEMTVVRSLSAGQHSAPLDLGRTLAFIWFVVHVPVLMYYFLYIATQNLYEDEATFVHRFAPFYSELMSGNDRYDQSLPE